MNMETYIIERLKEAEAKNAELTDAVRFLTEKNRKVESDLKLLAGYIKRYEDTTHSGCDRFGLSEYEYYDEEAFVNIETVLARYGISGREVDNE